MPLTDPKSQIYQDNPLWLKPGETSDQYRQRTQTISAEATEAEMPPTYEPPPPPDDVSLQAQLEQQRKAMEDAYQAEQTRIQTQLVEQRKTEADAQKEQEGILGQLEKTTTPFREELERTERQRLQIEENYFANQSLVNEMDRLLTESISLTRQLQTQKVPGLAGLQQSTRMIRAQETAQSRIAVIEAVMAARNNQIGVGLGFIDRTASAIQQDRQDRISYLNALFSFYETQRTEAGQKIFNLTKEEKDIINRQIGLLEDDYARTQAAADRIKDIMLQNPQMAAESGISLNDTEEEITSKIANWEYNVEVRDLKNKLEMEGIREITPVQVNTLPAEQTFTYTDSRGVERSFELPPATPDWELRTIGNALYRVDARTGQTQLLAGAPRGTGDAGLIDPDTGDSLTPFDAARWIVKNNPGMSDEELRLMIREQGIGLSETDIKNIIATSKPEATEEEIRTMAQEGFMTEKIKGKTKEEIEKQWFIANVDWVVENNWNTGSGLPEPEKSILEEIFPPKKGIKQRAKEWWESWK